MPAFEELATYKKCVEKVHQTWRSFLDKRKKILSEQLRHEGIAAEKVTENILEALFTEILDWPIGSIDHQVGHADLILTSEGIKYLIIEAKHPGALAWHRKAVEAALEQVRRYAEDQKVKCIGISDGIMLYAANIEQGGLKDRAFIPLESLEPPEQLWWLSVHGIYRPYEGTEDASLRLLPEVSKAEPEKPDTLNEEVLHPKYKIPLRCFAYVGSANKLSSWKLPYCLADGSIDMKRLPKAIQSILSNYRGIKVSGIPERDIPDVLVRLAIAAASIGKMPFQGGETAAIYHQLNSVLEQLGRLDEVIRVC